MEIADFDNVGTLLVKVNIPRRNRCIAERFDISLLHVEDQVA
jgi:hypothetical protein